VLTLIALALGGWSWYFIVSELPVGGVAAFAIADAILIPLAVRYGFRYLGRSPASHRTDVGTGSGLEETIRELERHVGREAVADTALRPAGKIRLDGDVFEAQAVGEFVEKGATVRLSAVRGAEFLVEKI
jgi:membrane protein implicated in regulation of membrane protease activity